MASVTEIPRVRACSHCGSKLRIATQAQIASDLKDSRYRQLAESAAQGSYDWTPPENWSAWKRQESASSKPAWLLRCDDCGARVLWSEMLPEQAE